MSQAKIDRCLTRINWYNDEIAHHMEKIEELKENIKSEKKKIKDICFTVNHIEYTCECGKVLLTQTKDIHNQQSIQHLKYIKGIKGQNP
jgi:hypothetical protein